LRDARTQLRQSLLDLRAIGRVSALTEIALERGDSVAKVAGLLVAVGDRDEDHRCVSQLERALEAPQRLDVRASFEEAASVVVRTASLDDARIFCGRSLLRTRTALRLRELRSDGERAKREKENGCATDRGRAFHGARRYTPTLPHFNR
jgi:hypothetical protein